MRAVNPAGDEATAEAAAAQRPVAFVTGASYGIGAATAVALARASKMRKAKRCPNTECAAATCARSMR